MNEEIDDLKSIKYTSSTTPKRIGMSLLLSLESLLTPEATGKLLREPWYLPMNK